MSLLRNASIAALALASGGLVACGGDDEAATPAPAPTVTVSTFMFEPDPLRVEAGTKITWINEDAAVHTVTTGTRERPDGRIDATLDASGGEFTAAIDEPGTYRYFCARHSGPGMTATLVVE